MRGIGEERKRRALRERVRALARSICVSKHANTSREAAEALSNGCNGGHRSSRAVDPALRVAMHTSATVGETLHNAQRDR